MVDPEIRRRAVTFVADYTLQRLRDGHSFKSIVAGMIFALRQEAKNLRVRGKLLRITMEDAQKGFALARIRHGREREIGIRFRDWSSSSTLDSAHGAQ